MGLFVFLLFNHIFCLLSLVPTVISSPTFCLLRLKIYTVKKEQLYSVVYKTVPTDVSVRMIMFPC